MTEIKDGTIRIFIDIYSDYPHTEIYVYGEMNWYKISYKCSKGVQKKAELIPYPTSSWRTFDYLEDSTENLGLVADITLSPEDIINHIKEKKNDID